MSDFIHFYLLRLRVLPISDVASIRKGIMHRQFLFQLLNLMLVPLYHESGVMKDVLSCFVLNTHHTGRELKS